MIFIDTHTHIYLDEFDQDRHLIVENAVQSGVKYMMLPNIDSSSMQPMLSVANDFPEHCFPMTGLHPTSVKENYREELKAVENRNLCSAIKLNSRLPINYQ